MFSSTKKSVTLNNHSNLFLRSFMRYGNWALFLGLFLFKMQPTLADETPKSPQNEQQIKRAVLDYIESQHQVNADLMARGLDKALKKRTYWRNAEGKEFIMETDYDFMVKLAASYNEKGDKFPEHPRVDIKILDIDQRVASVKLTVDDWIDYMHLYQTQAGEWKIINVLWQFHDTEKQVSK